MEPMPLSGSLANLYPCRESQRELQGWVFTSIGVLCFSLSFVTAQEIGGWRAICWILVFSAPLATTLLGSYLLWRGGVRRIDSASAWAGLLYQIFVSQFLGFAFYYRGLALGGVAKMSQVQQFQSVLAVLAAGVLLGERLDVRLWVVLALLLVAVVASRCSLRSPATH